MTRGVRTSLAGAGTRSPAATDVFAREWAAAVTGTSYVALTTEEMSRYLSELTSLVVTALTSEPLLTKPAEEVGARLVRDHFTGVGTLTATLDIIGTRLLADLGAAGDPRLQQRLPVVCGAIAAGYATALRDRTLTEQETISQAALRAKDQAEAALRVSEARFRAIFAEAGVGILLTDLHGMLLDVNPALEQLTGYRCAELLGRSAFDFVVLDEPRRRPAAYEEQVRGYRDHYTATRKVRHRDGKIVFAQITASLIRDEAGDPAYQVVVVEDLTERLQLQERLRHQALHDPLTGLANRTRATEWLVERFGADGSRAPARVGVCLLDVDRFRVINDSLGHAVGDELLSQIARRLDDAVGGDNRLVARMGGDEFAVLLAGTAGTEDMERVGAAVLRALAEPFRIAGHELSVAVSIGILERPTAPTTPAELMRDSDMTLDWAKADGTQWAVFEPERNDREVAKYRLAATMPAALERGEFYVDYQPLVRLSDGRLEGVEALVRWRHPELGRLGPDRFISLAEETGLIVALGRWVMEEACGQAGTWYRRFGTEAPFMSVNLAVRQAQEPDLVEMTREVLRNSELPPGLLQLELTESAIMSSAGEPLRMLQRLSNMGVRIAIDDFGTGYSNLAYLRNLPVHSLKMAGSFVAGLAHGEQSQAVDAAIVSTLVQLAHALGLSVTAEGVETGEQADRLRGLGCDCGQGWLFARPGPPDAIAAMLPSPHGRTA